MKITLMWLTSSRQMITFVKPASETLGVEACSLIQ